MQKRFPWHLLFALTSQRLGWSPQTIWAATPKEIVMALFLPIAREPKMNRKDFDLLCEAFPDLKAPHGHRVIGTTFVPAKQIKLERERHG